MRPRYSARGAYQGNLLNAAPPFWLDLFIGLVIVFVPFILLALGE